MNGIASLLDEQTKSKVEELWLQLESKCGLAGAKITPFPHITWQVSEGYDLPRLKSILMGVALNTHPFIVNAYGLGIFTGEKPVIHVSIFKGEAITGFHSRLWKDIAEASIEPSPLYAPGQWVPHVTLAYNDVNRDNINCALQMLVFQDFSWEIKIDNLIYISQIGPQITETAHFHFGN
jgi:2'-5' RNA ligase